MMSIYWLLILMAHLQHLHGLLLSNSPARHGDWLGDVEGRGHD